MEFLIQYAPEIFLTITAICGAVVAVASYAKQLRSETRNRQEFSTMRDDVSITREGIVQAFKDAVVTKDIKVSVNQQVSNILDQHTQELTALIKSNEEKRSKMTYWTLKILSWTAASNKLTKEQKAEVNELMSLIAEDEQIVDTDIV